MNFKDFLSEQKEKHAVMTFMRANPVTSGHQLVVNKVLELAKKHNASAHVILSHSQDPKKNPLSAAQKLKHAKRAFSGVNVSASDSSAPNFLAQAAKLHKQGVTHFHMVGGQDRVEEFHKLLHKYNGVKGPHGSFKFKHIEVHSAGDRDPDAEGVEGMSASKMREHASTGKFSEFKKGVPSAMSHAHAKEMYDDVRKGMNIKEDINDSVEELLNEGVHDQSIFKAVFLAGGPGSGKDYVLDNTLAGHGLTEINSDKALEFLMDKSGLDKTMPSSEKEKRDAVRGRAKSITELRQKLALLGRNGLIINGTGDDYEKIKRIKDRLEEIGYDTSMIMVNTDDEVSKQRNIERGQRGGRTVPEDVRKAKWDAVQASRPELAKAFGDRYVEFDNSQDLRNASPDVVKAKKDEMLELYKNVKDFVSQPPQSEAASMWVAHQMSEKDTLPIPKDGAEMAPHSESQAAEEARKMGLQYYGFGRYGQNGKVTHRSVHDKLVEVGVMENVDQEFEEMFSEDLRKWFSKTDPAGDWKRINSKGEAIGPCAREPGEPKPKCMSRAKRESLTKKERASAVRAKRRHDPNPERKGAPINVSNFGKGKLSESYSLSDSSAMNLLLLGTKVDGHDYDNFEEEKRAQEFITETKGCGDCFKVAGRAMITPEVPEIKLVHAYVTGQGPIAGKRFSHAWNEIGDVVLDYSNGRQVVMRKPQYYELGQISTEPGEYAAYNDTEAKKKMVQTRHWGPWDLDPSKEKKKTKLLKDKTGKVRTFMLRAAAAKEAHTINGTVMPHKNGYVIKLNEENDHVSISKKTIQNFRSTPNGSGHTSIAEQTSGLITEGVAELTTGQEYAKHTGIEAVPSSTQETGSSSQSNKLTLAKIRAKQKEKVKESIDKGTEVGISMAASGENFLRGNKLSNRTKKKPFDEAIGAGGEDVTSMSDFNDNVLKQKGINIKTFKAKRPIG